MKWLVCLLTLVYVQANEPPFWKAKPRLYERIQNGEIIVAVHSEDSAKTSPRKTLVMGGGGQTSVPRDFVFSTAQRFEDLPSASDYIKSAHYEASSHRLTLHVEAYGHKAEFVIELHAVQDVEPRRIDYTFVGGPLKGLTGQLTFADLGTRSEIGFAGRYKYDRLPIPRLFLEFGMEVVLQRMAMRLREFVQTEWHKKAVPTVDSP